VIEPPVTVLGLAAAVTAHPRAAAVTVELLRLLDGLDPAAGLVAESLAYGLLQGSAEHAVWLAARTSSAVVPPGAVRIVREDDVLRITLARAAAGNALDAAMRDALTEAFALAAIDRTIARVVLDAEGRAFCLGGDLAEFGTTRDPATAHHIRRATLPARWIAACADRLEAHVQGACVGAGLEIAAFATRLTASPNAWFQLPELTMGLLPGAGGCVSLARRIGRQRTALLVLSGRRISARVARDWGLVDALMDNPPGDHGQAQILG
jgi:enoyl-CoA hydratase/carnithine racemase